MNRLGYSTYEAVEPYVHGPEVKTFLGSNGEMFIARRHGPGMHQLDVSASCWSYERRPHWCCSVDNFANCWESLQQLQHCCDHQMFAVDSRSERVWYDRFVMLSKNWADATLHAWEGLLPAVKVDEEVFAAKRYRWRFGSHEPSPLCYGQYRNHGRGHSPNETALSVLLLDIVRILLNAGVNLTKTFVNLGSGSCLPPDPLYRLLHATEGRGFVGLAIDVNPIELHQCSLAMANASGVVLPMNFLVDHRTIRMNLHSPLSMLFGLQGLCDDFSTRLDLWPLDFLVVDIDGCDCLVAEEIMLIAQPKVLVLEIAFHIPPPFRFSMTCTGATNGTGFPTYDVRAFVNPTNGCSLSFALHSLAKYGFHLMQLTYQDAVFIHGSVAPILGNAFAMRFPQDEFLCFRRSHLWMQMPAAYVRDWFFAEDAKESLGYIRTNISSLNSQLGQPGAAFTVDYSF